MKVKEAFIFGRQMRLSIKELVSEQVRRLASNEEIHEMMGEDLRFDTAVEAEIFGQDINKNKDSAYVFRRRRVTG